MFLYWFSGITFSHCIRRFAGFTRIAVLHRPDVVNNGVNTKNMPYAKGTIEYDHFLVFGMHKAIYEALKNRFEYRSGC